MADDILIEIDNFMDRITDKIFAYSQENIVDKDKIDTGTMFKTANINRRFLEKEIVYPVPYADIVEYGRNPGTMPPPDALFNWVRRKLGIKNEKEAKKIAFAIAVSIKQRGIDPAPYLVPAIIRVISEVS